MIPTQKFKKIENPSMSEDAPIISKDSVEKDSSPGMSSSLRQRGGKGRRSSTAESIANAVAKKVPTPLRPVVVRFFPVFPRFCFILLGFDEILIAVLVMESVRIRWR